jgi:hypothetical protein
MRSSAQSNAPKVESKPIVVEKSSVFSKPKLIKVDSTNQIQPPSKPSKSPLNGLKERMQGKTTGGNFAAVKPPAHLTPSTGKST